MMVTIKIEPSDSVIFDLSQNQLISLRNELSYQPDKESSYYSGFFSKKKYLVDKKGHFPTGLLHRVERFLRSNNIGYELYDKRDFNVTSHFSTSGNFPHVPYKSQIDATMAAIDSKGGTISMPTGTGKSVVIAILAANRGTRTLIVVPTIEIKAQMQLLISSVFKEDSKFISVENIDSSALKNPTVKFEVLIIDEAHHSAASTYRKLNKTAWKDIAWRFCLTATPFRNNQEEQLLFESIAGPVVYKLTYADAVKNNQIVPIESFYVNLQKIDNNCHTWAEVYSKLVVNNESRNIAISDLLHKLDSAEKATLCLVKEVKHGEILSLLSGAPFVSGQDDTSRHLIKDFNSGKITTLIGTEGILGEGVDTKPAEYIVIAGLGKAKSAFMQKCGRGVRMYQNKTSAKIIIFKDRSHKFTMRHFNAQKKILLEEYGSEVVVL